VYLSPPGVVQVRVPSGFCVTCHSGSFFIRLCFLQLKPRLQLHVSPAGHGWQCSLSDRQDRTDLGRFQPGRAADGSGKQQVPLM
jgi:hypothetical protein